MWNHLALFVIIVIVVVAVVYALIFAKSSPPIIDDPARAIDTSHAEGRAEMMQIAQPAITEPDTDIIYPAVIAASASGSNFATAMPGLFESKSASQLFIICAIRGAADTNIRIAFAPASSSPVILAFAKDRVHARMFSTDGALIAQQVKFELVSSTASSDAPPHRLSTETQEQLAAIAPEQAQSLRVAEVRANLSAPELTASASSQKIKAMLIAPPSTRPATSIAMTPMTLSATKSRNVFIADHVWGRNIGFLVIDSYSNIAYLISPSDGRVITSIAGDGDIVASINWPASLRIPHAFCWNVRQM